MRPTQRPISSVCPFGPIFVSVRTHFYPKFGSDLDLKRTPSIVRLCPFCSPTTHPPFSLPLRFFSLLAHPPTMPLKTTRCRDESGKAGRRSLRHKARPAARRRSLRRSPMRSGKALWETRQSAVGDETRCCGRRASGSPLPRWLGGEPEVQRRERARLGATSSPAPLPGSRPARWCGRASRRAAPWLGTRTQLDGHSDA